MNACGSLSVYAFNKVVVTIDNRIVKGFWEGDDVVQVERQSTLGTALVGADGAAILTTTADQSARLTLRLMPNSALNEFLRNRANQQRQGAERIMSVAIRDTSNGEGGGCSAASILEEPTLAWGAQPGSRDWVLFCSCWQDSQVRYTPLVA